MEEVIIKSRQLTCEFSRLPIKQSIHLLLLAVSANLYANCNKPSKTLFECNTANGKTIEVCSFNHSIRYSFGKPQLKPELSLSLQKSQLIAESCYTCGRYISHSIHIPNGHVLYIVSWGVDRSTERTEGHVEVIANNKSKIISCVSEPKLGDVEGIKFSEISLE